MSANQLPFPSSFWNNEQQLLYNIVVRNVTSSATDGAQFALDDLIAKFGLGVDWGSVSADVTQWAQSYSFDLVKGITDTSRTVLQEAVSSWQQSGQPLPDLIERITPMFGETRAELIASTEVTRAYHQGNLTTWQDSSIVTGWQFMTAMDELVCPICGDMEETGHAGKIFDLNDDENAPPLHPRCRCYSQPVVKEP